LFVKNLHKHALRKKPVRAHLYVISGALTALSLDWPRGPGARIAVQGARIAPGSPGLRALVRGSGSRDRGPGIAAQGSATRARGTRYVSRGSRAAQGGQDRRGIGSPRVTRELTRGSPRVTRECLETFPR